MRRLSYSWWFSKNGLTYLSWIIVKERRMKLPFLLAVSTLVAVVLLLRQAVSQNNPFNTQLFSTQPGFGLGGIFPLLVVFLTFFLLVGTANTATSGSGGTVVTIGNTAAVTTSAPTPVTTPGGLPPSSG